MFGRTEHSAVPRTFGRFGWTWFGLPNYSSAEIGFSRSLLFLHTSEKYWGKSAMRRWNPQLLAKFATSIAQNGSEVMNEVHGIGRDSLLISSRLFSMYSRSLIDILYQVNNFKDVEIPFLPLLTCCGWLVCLMSREARQQARQKLLLPSRKKKFKVQN